MRAMGVIVVVVLSLFARPVTAAEWIAGRTGFHAFDAVLDDLTRA